MDEAEAAITLKQAMRRYSYNNLSESTLGMFKGLEDGAITVSMELDGIDLKFSRYSPVDVSKYEKQIASLEQTVEEQNQTIQSLQKPKEEEPVSEASVSPAAKKSPVVRKRKT